MRAELNNISPEKNDLERVRSHHRTTKLLCLSNSKNVLHTREVTSSLTAVSSLHEELKNRPGTFFFLEGGVSTKSALTFWRQNCNPYRGMTLSQMMIAP